MKSYPSIDGPSKAPRQPCIAFYKYDGSNLRWEWSKKRGWYKFGTRRRLFDHTDPDYGCAIPIFMESLAPELEAIFRKEYRDINQIIVFTEFFGPNSFAGQHIKEQKELRLIDVNLHKKGIIDPRGFVNIFGSLPFAAQIVYEGNLNEQLILDIRDSKYDVNEGVVCKGGKGHKLWMCKIKTLAYRKRLKEFYGEEWEEFWE